VHALILGYWHTIVTPPMVFAELVVDVVEQYREHGIHKPVVASLSGDVEVEQAAEFLYRHGIVAYPYTTEKPVAVLGPSTAGPGRRDWWRADTRQNGRHDAGPDVADHSRTIRRHRRTQGNWGLAKTRKRL